MTLSVNNKNSNSSLGTKLGTLAGVGTGGAYLLKNKEDIFVNTIKNSVNQYGSKKIGIISVIIASAATLLATTSVGALIGKVIDKNKPAEPPVKVPYTAPVNVTLEELTQLHKSSN